MRPAQHHLLAGVGAGTWVALDPGHHGRGRGLQAQRLHDLVHPGQDRSRGIAAVHGDPAQESPQLPHRGGGLDVVTHDVTHHDHHVVPAGTAALLEEGVVPVTADARGVTGGGIARDDLQVVRLRGLGQHAALQGLRDVALGGVEAGVVERERGARRDVLQVGLVVGGERRSSGTAEGAHDAHRALACSQRHDHRRGGIELAQPVAGRPRDQHGGDLGGRVRGHQDRPHLADREGQVGGVGQRAEAERGVGLQRPGHRRVGVRPGDVPQSAGPGGGVGILHQRDQTPVRHLRHEEGREAVDALGRVEGAGEGV